MLLLFYSQFMELHIQPIYIKYDCSPAYNEICARKISESRLDAEITPRTSVLFGTLLTFSVLGRHNIQKYYPQLNEWNVIHSFSNIVEQSECVISGKYMFLLGGRNGPDKGASIVCSLNQ